MNMPLLRNQAALQKSVERLNRWQSTSFIANPSYAVFTYTIDPPQSFTANVTRVLEWNYLYYNSNLDTNIQTPFAVSESSTTEILIPQDGVYVISLSLALSVAGQKLMVLFVNGINVQAFSDTAINAVTSCVFQRRLFADDVVEIGVGFSVNNSILMNSLDESIESPVLSITKIC